MLHVPSLYVSESNGKGRGIFTAEDLDAETIIELCPVIFIPKNQIHFLDKTTLYDYYFIWPDGERVCLALGYGSLYNHDKKPNAEVVFDLDNEMIVIKSISHISAGSEICIHYLGDGSVEMPYWF
jgi:SET domain-containing protein